MKDRTSQLFIASHGPLHFMTFLFIYFSIYSYTEYTFLFILLCETVVSDSLYREARSWAVSKLILEFKLETLMVALTFRPAEILKLLL